MSAASSDSWECAYGENAWQAPARLLHDRTEDPLSIGRLALLEGAALSPSASPTR